MSLSLEIKLEICIEIGKFAHALSKIVEHIQTQPQILMRVKCKRICAQTALSDFRTLHSGPFKIPRLIFFSDTLGRPFMKG